MSNETQTEIVETRIVSKISMKNAGVNPKKIFAVPEGQRFLKLAVILGEADGIKQVDDPAHGTVHEALTGRFQAQNAETGELTRSGMLYLPKGIHETVTAAVKKAEEGDLVRFALEVRSVRADNAAGYSYEAVPLLKPVEKDPLDELAAMLTDGNQKSLPADTAAPTAAPTPAPAVQAAPVKGSKK